MKNEQTVKLWFQFAEMDYSTALFVNGNMYPKPLEIICYHCQQSAEKNIKAILIANGLPLSKTHDLGLLLEALSIEIPEKVFDAADNLTPYGVKTRYPQEVQIDEVLVKKAIADMQLIADWAKSTLNFL